MTGAPTLLMFCLALAVVAGGDRARAQTPAQTEVPREDTLRSPGPAEGEVDLLPEAELPVFGSRMFTGAFAQQPFTGFNPDYRIQIGDQVRVQLWGAVDFGEVLTVDAQGNIFLPQIGPVRVLGVRNDALTELVRGQVRKVYRDQVGVYANLEGAQPVSVIVSGFVRRPGMFRGLSSDSILYFLDLAGGIDTRRGSFIDVRVLRGGKVRQTANLYEFLLEGSLPTIQFADGDTIYVGALTNTVSVEGAVHNAARFEFLGETMPAATVVGWATPRADATHVRVRRNNSGETTAEYLPLIALEAITLLPGDRVTLIPEDRPQLIVVGVNGEHDGAKEYVVTPGTRLGKVLDQIVPSERTRFDAIQLFRVSVKERQTALLQRSLDQLEREVLAARSSTDEEASLRLREAELIQSFIARARKLEPQGLVVLRSPEEARDLYLEDGDILFLPAKSRLITVAGEVMFPTAVTWRRGAGLKEYIEIAGGFTRTADTRRALIRRANGEIVSVSLGGFGQKVPEPGDEIMVLPQPNVKNLQLAKALAEILFQLAVTTNVVLDL